jgi:hypothetical protein
VRPLAPTETQPGDVVEFYHPEHTQWLVAKVSAYTVAWAIAEIP